MTGHIYFIGAGPGDPDLLTLKAQKLIAAADVVLYAGSLVNPAVLAHAPAHAEIHNSAGLSLEQQIEVMASAAAAGKAVARLHTGDPTIYGATLEQMRELDRLAIAYTVVPGVSSAFAATAALKTELTAPNQTQTIIFTRLGGRTAVPEAENLASLAAHRSSMVLFLSTGMIARVVKELTGAGYPADTPVAVVFRASWPDELVIRGTLATIAGQLEAAEITHQALIIVSPVLSAEGRQVADSHLYGAAFAPSARRDAPAIISLTRAGTGTARRLLAQLPGAVLYAPERFVTAADRAAGIIGYDTSVRQVLQSAFAEHSALICLMATGIVVRDLAPVLRSKHSDPAVVALDEQGRHAISLLSGHKGGANALAQQVAKALGGLAVLTTASDGQRLPALDLLGREAGWQLERPEQLTAVIAALVNGEAVAVYQNAGNDDWLPDPLPPNLTRYPSLAALAAAAPAAALFITDRIVPARLRAAAPKSAIYRPPSLVLGVGCNRGTPAAEILQNVRDALTAAGLSPLSVAAVATIEDKRDEIGLLEMCERQNWPLKIFSRAEIAAIENLPNPSEWAQKALGVAGVAEPAALLAANASELLLEKQKYPNVTVAVARKS
ncbi:MAG: Siroheme synthase [Anaerolineae bacterium]|nr:Siroheme synthase [Anaerolineae bacterium]